MAGAPKKAETKKLRLAVPANLYAYLGILVRNTILGASENDVAGYLLTERLKGLLEEKYHEKNKVRKA
jgi:hypothetical protein